MYIKFQDSNVIYKAKVIPRENVVTLEFEEDEIVVNKKGFQVYKDKKCEYLIGNYLGYNTIYRNDDETKAYNGIQLSNDGSVYAAPEPVPEPEPYVPTLGEVKTAKKQEIEASYQTVKAAGVDVEISTGIEHFPLTSEDVTFLMGKQFEMMSDASEKIAYQDSDNHCKFYSREDMQVIIQQALLFVNYQTTYRNNLCEWVELCSTFEEVEAISYGSEIPEDYQNEVYKSYLVQIGENE